MIKMIEQRKYYSNYGTDEEKQKALYFSYQEKYKKLSTVELKDTDTDTDTVSFDINRLNIITEVFTEVKKFCIETFKNPELYIQKIFKYRLSRRYAEIFSHLKDRRRQIFFDSILMSLSKVFEYKNYKVYNPTYSLYVEQAKIFETVEAPIVSKVENKRLLNLRKDFEDLIEYRRLWIIRMHLKLRELHKHPLYVAKSKLQGKKRQYKNFMEAVEKYHLRDTAIQVSKTADITKKLEVSHKNHNVKKQILWLQWTMADGNLPKIEEQLERYERAISINPDYQEIMEDIKNLREENKLFQRQKKQFQQVFEKYTIFPNVVVWECIGERHKIILAYPKVTL